MLITVNGKEYETADGTTVQKLLEQLGRTGPLAVELNRHICPRQRHGETALNNGDIVEIVTIVGGG